MREPTKLVHVRKVPREHDTFIVPIQVSAEALEILTSDKGLEIDGPATIRFVRASHSGNTVLVESRE